MYATRPDMEQRFGELELIQLTNPDDPHAEAVLDAVLDVALSDAAAEIDAVLSARYALPFQTIPAVLVPLACDIARYRLYSGKASEEVESRYKNATAMLKRIGSGDIDLGANAPQPGGAPVFATRAPAVFDEGLFQ